MQVTANNEA